MAAVVRRQPVQGQARSDDAAQQERCRRGEVMLSLDLLLPLLAGGGWEGVAFDLAAKSDPAPTLPCKQGREHGQIRTRTDPDVLLPLLCRGRLGGGLLI